MDKEVALEKLIKIEDKIKEEKDFRKKLILNKDEEGIFDAFLNAFIDNLEWIRESVLGAKIIYPEKDRTKRTVGFRTIENRILNVNRFVEKTEKELKAISIFNGVVAVLKEVTASLNEFLKIIIKNNFEGIAIGSSSLADSIYLDLVTRPFEAKIEELKKSVSEALKARFKA